MCVKFLKLGVKAPAEIQSFCCRQSKSIWTRASSSERLSIYLVAPLNGSVVTKAYKISFYVYELKISNMISFHTTRFNKKISPSWKNMIYFSRSMFHDHVQILFLPFQPKDISDKKSTKKFSQNNLNLIRERTIRNLKKRKIYILRTFSRQFLYFIQGFKIDHET